MAYQNLSEIISALPIPAFLVDASARIRCPNKPALVLFGDDIEDRNYITMIRQPSLVTAIETAVRHERNTEAKYTLATASTDRIYEAKISWIANERLVLVCLEDKTPVHEAGMMRRDFVANVSHELRTPLTALLGFIDTLQGPARDDPAALDRFLGMMAKEAQRMNRLVADLLSLSRVEFSERKHPHARVRLKDVLSAARNSVADSLDRSRISIEINENLAERAEVVGDADQLRQVFNNLFENALKYGRPETRVEVTMSEGANDIYLRCPFYRIEVRDQGEGIAQHHIPRLTERFYRVDDHRSRELGGTGLGLAIVKHIVQRHGGRLDVTSTQGVGSCFSAILRKT